MSVPSSGLWRDRDFLKLWAGQTISEIGSRITREGIPLTAVLLLQATPAQMGLLASLNGFGALLFGPIAGVVADRFRLRPILIATDLGRAGMLALVPLLYAQGQLTMTLLCVIMAGTAVFTTFFDVAYQSLLPSLVRRDQLLDGNAKLTMSLTTAEVVGPAGTGLLVQSLGAPRAIALDAASFLVSALSVALISPSREVVKDRLRESSTDGFSEISAGFRLTFSNPILRALALRSATASFFYGFFATLYVIYAVQELRFTPVVLGVVVTLGGIGAFMGAIFAERIARRFSVGRTMIGAAVTSGVLSFLIPLAPGPGWVAVACLGAAQLFGDIAYPVYGIHEATLRQSITPPGLLGRVTAFAQLLFKGCWPVGALVGGTLATWFGMRMTFVVCAAGVLASAAWLVFSPVRGLVEHVAVATDCRAE
jgi:predicted MFS family arabinose efflux permease